MAINDSNQGYLKSKSAERTIYGASGVSDASWPMMIISDKEDPAVTEASP